MQTGFGRIVAALFAAVAGVSSGAGNAQCLEWSPGFEVRGTDGSVHASAVFDDGSGPALYVAGKFRTAGDAQASNVARWDGSKWSAVGAGTDLIVYALEVFDDGSGPALYAGGSFHQAGGAPAELVARWDGTTWSPLGAGIGGGFGGVIWDLAVFDDGTGPAVYAGGTFNNAGGVFANGIARWDGSSWSALGPWPHDFTVHAMEVFDDGTGPALFAGGCFTWAGGQPGANRIAKWDGASWSPLGAGLDNCVNALAVFDDGSGPALFAGGDFQSSGSLPLDRLARWDGASWLGVGGGVTGSPASVGTLAVHDDGTGPALYAGGTFTRAGGAIAQNVARWNGASWSPVGGGIESSVVVLHIVETLAVFDAGSGPALIAGGWFDRAGGAGAANLASWKGASWSSLGSGEGIHGDVRALVEFDDGGGPDLYAAGSFAVAGSVPAGGVARRDASGWSALGTGVQGSVSALAAFDDGTGPALYVGGAITKAGGVLVSAIARWNGASWSPVGSGLQSNGAPPPVVLALASFDDGSGPALYAAGAFTHAGGIPAKNIARWNGTAWSSVGGGLFHSYPYSTDQVAALAIFDAGNGPALYAAGDFSVTNGAAVTRIARWDGNNWSALGDGLDMAAHALEVFDDGGGAALFVGGSFTLAGGSSANRIARWNGASWSALGSGVDEPVYALGVFDDGSAAGPALYVGGDFLSAGGAAAERLADWNGLAWTPLLPGASGPVLALEDFDDGNGAALYAGGEFTVIGGKPSGRFAQGRPCGSIPTTYCTAKPNSCGTLPAIQFTGAPSASATAGFTIAASNAPTGKPGLLLYTSQGKNALPFQGGFLCVAGPLRGPVHIASGGSPGQCDSTLALDMNAFASGGAGGNPAPFLSIPGQQVNCQWWGRDAPASGSLLSDGIEYTVGP
jgi:hypothetical protein